MDVVCFSKEYHRLERIEMNRKGLPSKFSHETIGPSSSEVIMEPSAPILQLNQTTGAGLIKGGR